MTEFDSPAFLQFMGRIIERKFSGTILHLPEGTRLFVKDVRTGERVEIVEDVKFYMKQRFSWFAEEFYAKGLQAFVAR